MKLVRDIFRGFTEHLEGRTRFPYADVEGLVTVSFGCLIDPLALALQLEWRIGDRRATEAEVRRDWDAVKAIGKSNRTAVSQASLTTIRLADNAVESLLWRRFDANVAWLVRHSMPGLASFPPDAQLGIMATVWAIGCDFRNTKPPRLELIDACNRGDWLAARDYSRLEERGNAGVVDRNRASVICFENAAAVTAQRLPRDKLWWPNRCPSQASNDDLVSRTVSREFAALQERLDRGSGHAMQEHDRAEDSEPEPSS